MVKHIIPNNLREALNFIKEGNVILMGGGTDLMIQKRNTAGTPPRFEKNVVYLANLKELNYIKVTPHEICIGAMTPLETILESKMTPSLLKTGIGEMASPGIRHTATLAGNIANASPAGDGIAVLYALDARLVLESIREERTIPIEEFITGVRKTVLKPDELIKEIRIPKNAFTSEKWVKVGGRKADAISKVSFVGACTIKDHRIEDLRMAFGAIAPTVIRSRKLEKTLQNRHVSEVKAEIANILKHYDDLFTPIDDQRSNKDYRRQVANNLARDFILGLEE